MPTRSRMGAIDPVLAQRHIKVKSASMEARPSCFSSKNLSPNQYRPLSPPSIRCSAINLHESSPDEEDDEHDDEFFHFSGIQNSEQSALNRSKRGEKWRPQANKGPARKLDGRTKSVPDSNSKTTSSSQDSLTVSQSSASGSTVPSWSPSAAQRARNFLSVAISGLSSPLRPAASATCLFSSLSATSLDGANIGKEQMADSLAPDKEDQRQQQKHKKKNKPLASIPTRASLTHDWRRLRTPNKCRECNLLVYFNGRECTCCGFIVHKKCLITLVIKCVGSLGPRYTMASNKAENGNQSEQKKGQTGNTSGPQQQVRNSPTTRSLLLRGHTFGHRAQAKRKPLFGQPLDCIENEQVLDFIRRFVYEIDTRGLNARGIYRVSSIKSKVDRLCQYYDQNPSNLIDLSSFHPNIIANALKIFLRQLPEPLFSNKLYQQFIEMAKKYSQQPQAASMTASTSATTFSAPSSNCSSSNSTCSSSSSVACCNQAQRQHSSEPSSPKDKLLAPHNELAAAAAASRNSGCKPESIAKLTRQFSSMSSQQPNAPPDHFPPNLEGPNHTQKATGQQQQQQPSWTPANFVEDVRKLLDQLPEVNREIIGIILRHLRRVADMSDENQMSPKNLSIIFGPTLLNLENKNKSLAIVDNIHQARLIELMITWAYEIFPNTQAEEVSYIELDYSSHVSC